jgi:PST family polysaccharide transporter
MLSAGREVAKVWENSHALSRLVASVNGAKSLLLIGTLVLAVGAIQYMPIFSQSPQYVLWGWLLGVVQGFNPIWYFQGIQKAAVPALVDATSRLIVLVLVLQIVSPSTSGWTVLAIQTVGGIVSTLYGLSLLYINTKFSIPTISESLWALRQGWGVFLYRLGTSFYTLANNLLLSLVVAPSQLGYYAGAERVTAIAISGFWPLWRVLYSHVNLAPSRGNARSNYIVGLSIMTTCGVGIAFIFLAYWFANPLIHIFLGPGYESSVDILKLLAPIVPLAGLTGSLAILRMLPLRLDMLLTAITYGAVALHVISVMLLVPKLGIKSMAIIVVVIECLLAISMIVVLKIKENMVSFTQSRSKR